MNNPIKYIDPDGRNVIVSGQDGVDTAWSPGRIYKGADNYTIETFAALNQISSDRDANGNATDVSNLVDNLVASKDYTDTIRHTSGNTEAQPGLAKIQGKDIAMGNYDVVFNPTQGFENIATGDSFSPDVALVHELAHIEEVISNPSEYHLRSATPNEKYGDFEEARTMIRYEKPYAKRRGILVRDYRTYSDFYTKQIGNIPKRTTNSITN